MAEENHTPQETKQAPESNYISTIPINKFGMSGSILARKDEEGHCHYVSILDAEVVGTSQYLQLIDLLYHAKEGDTVTIRIFSYGGQVDSGVSIIQAIQNTKAKVITVGMSIVASIAAVIWMCGHERRMMKNSALMVHMPSGNNGMEKTLKTAEECTQLNTYFAWLLRTIGKDVITEDEFVRIIENKEDTFIPANLVNERLNAKGGNHAV